MPPLDLARLLFYQFLFMRTRRVISFGGFLTTSQNIIDVARERPYLRILLDKSAHNAFEHTEEAASPRQLRID